MYLILEIFLRYKTNILFLAFNYAKEKIPLKDKLGGYLAKLFVKKNETRI